MAYTTRRAANEAVSGNGPRIAPGRPRTSRSAERQDRSSYRGVDFESFVSTFRHALVPASPLEQILADRLILAAWRLQLASAVEFDTALAGDDLPPLSRETQDAEHTLEKSLELLEASRADRLGRDDRSAPEPTATADDERDEFADTYAPDEANFSNEWPTLPVVEDDADDADPVDADSAVAPRWQDRLVFDFNVSETSPVVKGTWVTVGHVVTLIVDGWNWSDILRTHPELTEDDIRICLSYAVEQDNDGGV